MNIRKVTAKKNGYGLTAGQVYIATYADIGNTMVSIQGMNGIFDETLFVPLTPMYIRVNNYGSYNAAVSILEKRGYVAVGTGFDSGKVAIVTDNSGLYYVTTLEMDKFEGNPSYSGIERCDLIQKFELSAPKTYTVPVAPKEATKVEIMAYIEELKGLTK